MISELRGNLLGDDALALVITVNTVGVIDKGIPLQFKRCFPANDAACAQACKLGQAHTGHKLPINLPDLRQLTVKRERIEFKAGWNPDATIRTLCAFANDFENLGGGYADC